jgi:hypothetical protein
MLDRLTCHPYPHSHYIPFLVVEWTRSSASSSCAYTEGTEERTKRRGARRGGQDGTPTTWRRWTDHAGAGAAHRTRTEERTWHTGQGPLPPRVTGRAAPAVRLLPSLVSSVVVGVQRLGVRRLGRVSLGAAAGVPRSGSDD